MIFLILSILFTSAFHDRFLIALTQLHGFPNYKLESPEYLVKLLMPGSYPQTFWFNLHFCLFCNALSLTKIIMTHLHLIFLFSPFLAFAGITFAKITFSIYIRNNKIENQGNYSYIADCFRTKGNICISTYSNVSFTND